MNTVAFHTLGCKVNQYETEAMEKLFQDAGYKVVDEDSLADIYVINTCTVTNLSDRKSRQFIRKSKRKNQHAIIAVVGCYSQVSPEEIEKIEGVDVILGTSERNKIVDLCEEAKEVNSPINLVRNTKTYKEFEKIEIDDIKHKTRAYIKVQDGCNQYCSYCIIPYARGPIRSRQPHDVLEEVKRLGKSGFKEVILTGIHIASYGKDLGDTDLGTLIGKISQAEGIERIRLSSIEPNIITDDFMKNLLDTKKVCDHFHLSLQSGSNSVLKRMHRRYTKEEYKEKVELIRKYMPNSGITTDIIVGFPGESPEEFNETLEFVRDIGFSRIHVFKYSPKEGTPAAGYENQIQNQIKAERSRELIELGDRMTREFNSKYLNKTIEVLYEMEEENYLEGYSSNYVRVKVSGNKNIVGNIIESKVIDLEDDLLIGEIRR